ncbi:hypothetical protein Krac_6093 [Ktedonobacter racemifer DSM 44963]|uniref:Uncharacterized protein n=1 Tax=Ktedonobacter racemifer DSM 44963 TaxID=485913 RepID=D6TXW8_KTERA|nr:hypothetical protein Krac_6093 [Ktedonobacter racemifer DSM 44963]
MGTLAQQSTSFTSLRMAAPLFKERKTVRAVERMQRRRIPSVEE